MLSLDDDIDDESRHYGEPIVFPAVSCFCVGVYSNICMDCDIVLQKRAKDLNAVLKASR